MLSFTDPYLPTDHILLSTLDKGAFRSIYGVDRYYPLGICFILLDMDPDTISNSIFVFA